jgi:hypothetical protein
MTLEVGGGSEQCAALAKTCPKLVKLSHSGTSAVSITAQDVASVRAFPKLEEFRLARVTDSALPGLLEIPNLARVVIDYSPITDAGLAVLVSHKGLRAIVFDISEITDAGLQRVAAMRTLTKITLGDSPKVTDAGIAALKKVRPDLKISR